MNINCQVHAQAKKNQIIKLDDQHYQLKITAPAINNQANLACIKLLAQYFQVKKSQVWLKRGQNQKQKVFEILI